MIYRIPKIIVKISITVIVLLLFVCGKQSDLMVHNYRSIRFIHSLDFVKADDNQLFTVRDSVNLFYCGSYIIYEMPRYYEFTAIHTDKQGNENESPIRRETKYAYMIYNKANNYGYMFDSLMVKNPYKISVDSFLMNTEFKSFPFYMQTNDTLIDVVYNRINHILTEKRICKNKADFTYPDTMCYYFNKDFNRIDFTFSKKLDSARKMKLYKVEFIYNQIAKGSKMYSSLSKATNGSNIPKRVFLFEIKNNSYDTTAIENFVDRFKKEEETLGSKKQSYK